MSTDTEKKFTLLYFFDPLCGWCYGFSAVMLELYRRYKDRVRFEVIPGGMMIGERAGSINEVAPYIKTAYRQVEELSGLRFGEAYLHNIVEPGTTILDSEPPSVAFTVLRSFDPAKNVEFAYQIQQLIFVEGIDPNLPSSYHALAARYGIDAAEFDTRFADPSCIASAHESFWLSRQAKVNGFPSVFFYNGTTNYIIAQGYTSLEAMCERIDKLIEETA